MEKDKNSKKHSTSSQVTPVPVLEKVQDTNVESRSAKKKNGCHIPKKTWVKILTIVYWILDFLTLFKSISVIVLSILAAIAAKVFASKQQGRIAALIIVCITAALTLTVCIFSMITLVKKKKKQKKKNLVYASAALIALAVIQLIIASAVLVVDESDKANLEQGLIVSFKQSLETNSNQHQQWLTMQHDFKCCGLNSPEDYRLVTNVAYYPPDVPIACCPAYDPFRSEISQERERERCKSYRQYYKKGCKELMEDNLLHTAAIEMHVVICFIILEVITSIVGIAVAKLIKKYDGEDSEDDDDNH